MMVGFPNVPIAPGVPPLPRLPGSIPAVITLLVQDAISLFGLGVPQQWGLFLNGAPAILAESVVSFEFKSGANISDFQVEQGGFESYNKVQRPFDVRLRFSTGGTAQDRQALLASLEQAKQSLDLYDAVTPEMTYESVNVIDYSYRRTAQNGFAMIVVDVLCEQVRQQATSSFTSTGTSSTTSTSSASTSSAGTGTGTITIRPVTDPQSPSAAPQINDGVVQPATPTAAQQATVSSVLSSSSLPF